MVSTKSYNEVLHGELMYLRIAWFVFAVTYLLLSN